MNRQQNEQHDSLFKDASPRGSPSSSNLKMVSAELGLNNLYQYIGVPNRLPKTRARNYSDVRTANGIKFSKLPDNMYAATSSGQEKEEPQPSQPIVPDLNSNKKVESSKPGLSDYGGLQTLFDVYSKQDPNLVYLKYKDQGNIEVKQQFYASYYANIESLSRGNATRPSPNGDSGRSEQDAQSIEKEKSIQFDSRFESGNLYAAYKVSEYEYDLILQNDINTRGHTQWFFFSVSGTTKGQKIKFNIVNLLKPGSLFNDGMKPAVFSVMQNSTDKEGWKREGSNVSYFKSNLAWEGPSIKSYYTLTFTHVFQHTNDTVYFAHSFPYTYSHLREYLTNLTNDPQRKLCFVRRTLCRTLLKNECEVLSVTSPTHIETISQRFGIVITARQHPGETLSSYMMEGFINFITSEDPEAQFLRDHCIFKIVPMLNPDGVIHGNYRTSLSGRDLNRIWNKPSQTLHSTIYHTKQMIRKFQAKREVKLVCDLHGHSRKKNAFFYGNSDDIDPHAYRLFPFILSKFSKYVSFEDCRFVVQKTKEKTARVNLWQEFKIQNVLTLEASFFGYDQASSTYSFTIEDYRNLGADLGKAIYIYIKEMVPAPAVEPRGSPTRTVKPLDCQELIKELQADKRLIDFGNNDDDSGSDTDNSEDNIPVKELNKILSFTEANLFKTQTRRADRTLELVKKKSSSVVPAKKEDKQTMVEKIDRSFNTEAILPIQEKVKQDPPRSLTSRTHLKKVVQIAKLPLPKNRFLAHELQESPYSVEMVSKSVQTDTPDQETPQESSYNYNISDLRPHLRRPKSSKVKVAVQSLMESGGLVILGAKTGLDLNGGIDTSYQLRKNQVSRFILAKLSGAAPTKESSRSYTPYMPYRQSPETFTPAEQKPQNKYKYLPPGGFKGAPMIKPGFSKEKFEEIRLNCCKTEMSLSPKKETTEDNETTDRKRLNSRKSYIQKSVLGPNQIPKGRLLASQRGSRQTTLSPSPLQEFLASNYMKTEPRDPDPYSLLNESKKMSAIDEGFDDSFVRVRLSKAPPQQPPSPTLPSTKRGIEENPVKKPEKVTASKLKGLFGANKVAEPYVYKIKGKESSPTLRTNSTRPVFASEYRQELEKRIAELGLLRSKSDRKQHRSVRKI